VLRVEANLPRVGAGPPRLAPEKKPNNSRVLAVSMPELYTSQDTGRGEEDWWCKATRYSDLLAPED
jgi:hypothetical protein